MALRQFLRFALVGVANTAAHFAVLVMLVEGAGWRPLPGNAAAFILASALSFQINARFTFESSAHWQRYLKFLAVSVVGLGVNSAAMQAGQSMGLHYLMGASIGVVASVVLGFVLNRTLVFAR